MVRYDEHAEFQIERRGIARAWIEETILNPDRTDQRFTPVLYQVLTGSPCRLARGNTVK